MSTPCRMTVLAVLAALTTRAAAHDFWIEPSEYRVALGDPVKVGLRVGENFKGEIVPRDNQRLTRFAVFGPAGEKEIIGRDGKEPAGYLRLDQPGLYTLVYQSNHARLELPAAKFNQYLEEEGLDAALALRKQRGQLELPGKERYSRSVKSFISTPGAATTGFDRVIGMPLEIVPLVDPLALKPGGELRVRLLFQGKPIPNVRIAALSRAPGASEMRVRTDADGVARFTLDQAGPWLLACVHMIESPPDSGADWESFWSSLTLELPAPAGP